MENGNGNGITGEPEIPKPKNANPETGTAGRLASCGRPYSWPASLTYLIVSGAVGRGSSRPAPPAPARAPPQACAASCWPFAQKALPAASALAACTAKMTTTSSPVTRPHASTVRGSNPASSSPPACCDAAPRSSSERPPCLSRECCSRFPACRRRSAAGVAAFRSVPRCGERCCPGLRPAPAPSARHAPPSAARPALLGAG